MKDEQDHKERVADEFDFMVKAYMTLPRMLGETRMTKILQEACKILEMAKTQ